MTQEHLVVEVRGVGFTVGGHWPEQPLASPPARQNTPHTLQCIWLLLIYLLEPILLLAMHKRQTMHSCAQSCRAMNIDALIFSYSPNHN